MEVKYFSDFFGRRFVRALQGALLAFFAPLGWLLIQFLSGVSPLDAFKADPYLYYYMLFGTTVSFVAFAFRLGIEEERLRQLALIDGLTGLFNARYFHERLHDEIETAKRYNLPLSLAVLDLDHFKLINDTYGHQVGDIVLKNVASVLMRSVRQTDFVARAGGEEFVVLFSGTNADDAAVVAERIRMAVKTSQVRIKTGGAIGVNVSIGVAGTPHLALLDGDVLYARADAALYQAKQSGRDRVVVDRQNGVAHPGQ
ncbi:GGDEF domain-containing protein [Desulfovibrio inopinatus]|uniref:GGDEF domain-containing protein n=1 Tax=Desulfovibrio inopinatus TaxID=102109 RepID=UPI000404E06F|nr:GGDEF domain-containing protein [Desulfovibrio inopinatus]